MTNIRRVGPTLLSASDDANGDQRDLNIIFVHGLRGHPRATWSHLRSTSANSRNEDSDARIDEHKTIKSFFRLSKSKKVRDNQGQSSTSVPADIFWPEDFLVPDLPKARIWTYGYNADVIGGLFQANNKNSISQHGRDLAVQLDREIDNKDPMIFVAHSLGGIILKDALHRSETICKRTRLIIFLGTPHRGSAYAGWGEIASNLASLGLQDSNKRLVQTLEVNGEVLDNIHEEFKTILSKSAIRVHSFQEAKGISGMKGLDNKVVDNFSSKLDLAREQETVETIDANHMEMARCSSRDDAHYRQICGVLKQFIRTELSNRETSLAETTDRSSLAKLFIVPFLQDDHFIGREAILGELNLGGQRVGPTKHRRDALVGLGGVGKSQIAIEHAYRVQKHKPQTAVFWIHASTKSRFEQAYQEIAVRLELPGRDDPKANVLRLVYNWLSNEANGQWLMILDNVDDGSVFFGESNDMRGISLHDQTADLPPPLETFLPQSPNGSILITSRNSTAATNLIANFGNLIPVEPMEEADSVELFKAKILGDNSSESDWKELAQALEGIPLAITHAAAYIRSRPRVTVSTYLRLFRESEVNQARLLSNEEMKDLRRDYSNRHAVITTWQISFAQIQQTKTESADLLALMSMFDRQGIPERLLLNNMDQLQFEEALAPLISFSLVREQAGGSTFEMHRLVQLSTREWVGLNRQRERWRSEAIKVLVKLFPSGEYETWSDCQNLLPHVREIMSSRMNDQQDLLDLASINANLGWFYLRKGNLVMAKSTLQDAIIVRENELGASHQHTLYSINKLGVALEMQGRYNEAESMHRRALEGKQKELGASHQETLISVDNLGVVLEKQGRYNEAESMHRQALEGKQKELGASHQDTLISVNNLGVVLEKQGRYNEAESMHRRALEGRQKELGASHQDTLISVNNLGVVLEKQGRYNKAESIYRRALEGAEEELGATHPHTLTFGNNLAYLLERQGRFDEVEAVRKRALEGN